MNTNIAIIAALSGELRPFLKHASVKGWRRRPSSKGVEVWEYRHAEGCWLAVCAGMGAGRATAAFAEAERFCTIDAVCSVGWAGALNARIGAGSVCYASQVIDVKTGERYRPANWLTESPVLVTTPEVADAGEKVRLAASYGAGLVDMEAASIARIALGKGVPFYCIKAVSDDAEARLPDLNPFIAASGQLKMLPFLAHVAVRPSSWPGLVKLGVHSAAAARNLAESIYKLIDESGSIRTAEPSYTDGKR